jgi:S1-C subfamily serine protease
MRLDTSAEGVVILDVQDGSPAQSVGLRRGDVVVSVNNEKVARTKDLARLAKTVSRIWRVTIERGGRQISAVFGG